MFTSNLNVTIVQVSNGFLITDLKTGEKYIATELSSYSYSSTTVVAVLSRIVEDSQPEATTTTTEEVI